MFAFCKLRYLRIMASLAYIRGRQLYKINVVGGAVLIPMTGRTVDIIAAMLAELPIGNYVRRNFLMAIDAIVSGCPQTKQANNCRERA